MRPALATVLLAAGLVPCTSTPVLAAQNVSGAVEGTSVGVVVLRYPVDDGVEVCEDGIRVRGSWHRGGGRRGWPDRCTQGEAQIRLEVRDGEVRDLALEPADSEAGPGVDLGVRSAEETAAYLLELARTARTSRVAEDALFPALIARDVSVWPELLDIARDGGLRQNVRDQARFWLGQEVAAAAEGETESGVERDDPEHEVREAAVFALSQRPAVESIPILMDLARTSGQPEVRRSAVFWLSQTDDERVVDFFEAMLRRGGDLD